MMQRLLRLTSLFGVLALLLVACGGTPTATESTSSTAAPAADSSQPTTAADTSTSSSSGSAVIKPPALQIPTDSDPRDGILKPEPIPDGLFPITAEKSTLRIAIPNNASVEDFNTNSFTKWYEEKTNVHIEWVVLPSGDEGIQKLNLMLSSGDIPEVIMGFSLTAAQVELYGSQGLFIPLNDLIDTYAVNVQNAFAQYPLAKDIATSPGGQIYSLPEVNDCYHCTMSQKLWIYQPWLDKLGLKVPETLDEYEQVLKAFKEQDPNGNGQADELPLTSNVNGWNSPFDYYFMNAFTFNPGSRIVLNNGTIEATYSKPEWREGLRYLNKLYGEGLLDPNSFTQDSTAMQRVGQGDPNVVGSIPWGYPGWLPIDGNEGSRWNQYVVVPPLAGPSGTRIQPFNPYVFSVGRFIVTKAAKDPALAVRWGDGFYQQEVEINAYLGPEGVGWRWATEGEKGINGEQALYVPLKSWGNIQNDQWMQTNTSFRSSDFRLTQMSDNPWELETVLYRETKKLEPYAQDASLYVPPLYSSTDDAQEVAEFEVALKKYVEEMEARFVSGDANINSDDEWNAYLETLNQTGLPRYLELLQKAYDAKYKK